MSTPLTDERDGENPASEVSVQAEAPAEPAPPPAGPTPGEQLRAERERQGLSVGEVARQLKLAPRQVEALERNDHASLPGSVFVRGFLRNYGRALGLDADALVRQAFGEAERSSATGVPPAASQAPTASPLPDKSPLNVPVYSGGARRRGATTWIAAGVVLAVVAVGAVVFLAGRGAAPALSTEVVVLPSPVLSQSSDATPVPSAAPEAQSEAAPAREAYAAMAPSRAEPEPAPVSGAPDASAASVIGTRGPEMRFSFSRESWVEVRDGDGRVIFSQLNPEGSERVIRGKPPLELVVGSASGVALAYRGKPVDLGPHTRTDVARLTLE